MAIVDLDSKKGTKVYTEYDVDRVPATPGAEWVRFVLVSDSHSQTTRVPDGDVLLHAGDLTTLGQPDDLKAQVEWIKSLPHSVKVFVCGNHDFSASSQPGWYENRGRQLNRKFNVHDADDDAEQANKILSQDNLGCAIKYLDNEAWSFTVDRKETKHHRWSVWGSPWSPEFEDWAWNYTRGEQAKEVHSRIPKDTQLLITHTPPYKLGKLDAIHNGTPVGCEELTRRLTAPASSPDALRPLLHVFGHIHEARGVHLLTQPAHRADDIDETLLVNAALVEYDQNKWNNHRIFSYDVVCQPVIVDLRVPAASSL